MKKFTDIIDLTNQVRLTRIDKIRLGAKLVNEKGKEYSIELPFFLLPDSVAVVHGDKIENIVERAKFLGVKTKKVLDFISKNGYRLAEELPVMIPVGDRSISFPQALKFYGASTGLKCIGNGEEASERQGVTNNWKDKACPCPEMRTDDNPKGQCTKSGNLQVILPAVNMGGIYQIDIGSINSIIDINSAFKTVVAMIGRIAMVPLMLRRVPTMTHHGGQKQIHWTCQLMVVGNIEQIAAMKKSDELISHNQIMQIEEPTYNNPQLDIPDAVYTQPEYIAKMINQLDTLRDNKKLTKSVIERIRTAIEDNDDEEIEVLHAKAMKEIPTGSTADDVAKKLKKKQEDRGLQQAENPPPMPPVKTTLLTYKNERF